MPESQVVKNSTEGKFLRVVGDTVRVLAAGEDTGGTYELFEFQSPRDGGPPLHAHPWTEAYLMLDGEIEVTIGDSKINATAGCFLNIPAGTLHAHRILSEGAKFIVISNPVGAMDFYTDMDREVGESVEEVEKIIGIALRHGFNVPPPPA